MYYIVIMRLDRINIVVMKNQQCLFLYSCWPISSRVTTERQKWFLFTLLEGCTIFINLLNNINLLRSTFNAPDVCVRFHIIFIPSTFFFKVTSNKCDEYPSCGNRADRQKDLLDTLIGAFRYLCERA
jgi:hypothetical protein